MAFNKMYLIVPFLSFFLCNRTVEGYGPKLLTWKSVPVKLMELSFTSKLRYVEYLKVRQIDLSGTLLSHLKVQ